VTMQGALGLQYLQAAKDTKDNERGKETPNRQLGIIKEDYIIAAEDQFSWYSYASNVLVAKISPHNNRTQPPSQTHSKTVHNAIKIGVFWVN
jgi:hypothetical protein